MHRFPSSRPVIIHLIVTPEEGTSSETFMVLMLCPGLTVIFPTSHFLWTLRRLILNCLARLLLGCRRWLPQAYLYTTHLWTIDLWNR